MRSLSTARLRGPSTLLLFLTAGLLPACGDGEPTAPGQATRVRITRGPSDAVAGEPISPAIEVQIQDEAGDRVTASSGPVTIQIGTNPGGAVLKGTTEVDVESGVATFDDLEIRLAASGYTLEASVSGVGSDVSRTFEIAPGPASELAFLAGPSDIEGQESISPAVAVEVRDDFGNRVTTFSEDVSLAIADDPTDGEATLSGATTVSAADGVATFSDLTVARPGDGYTLEATATGTTPDTSRSFSVNLTFVQVDAGWAHTCGVTTAEHAYCWGINGEGMVGDGTFTDHRSTPVPVATSATFLQVSAGLDHTCGVTTSNEVLCWGDNVSGQLGRDIGDFFSSSPVTVETSESFAQVSAGGFHTCGVTVDDRAFCWGSNGHGQLGDGSGSLSTTPVAVDVSGLSTQSFAQVSAGGRHTCAVTTTDEAFCWGNNGYGQLGDGTTDEAPTPVAVSGGLSFVQVSAGQFRGAGAHTCGVTTSDHGYCWGENDNGQLGDGSTDGSLTPELIDDPFDPGNVRVHFARISAGQEHTCGVTPADVPYCWGHNSSGQLGLGDRSNRGRPRRISTLEPFRHVTTGSIHSCGLSTADEAYCWGDNTVGQLGDGTGIERPHPVRVVQ